MSVFNLTNITLSIYHPSQFIHAQQAIWTKKVKQGKQRKPRDCSELVRAGGWYSLGKVPIKN